MLETFASSSTRHLPLPVRNGRLPAQESSSAKEATTTSNQTCLECISRIYEDNVTLKSHQRICSRRFCARGTHRWRRDEWTIATIKFNDATNESSRPSNLTTPTHEWRNLRMKEELTTKFSNIKLLDGVWNSIRSTCSPCRRRSRPPRVDRDALKSQLTTETTSTSTWKT